MTPVQVPVAFLEKLPLMFGKNLLRNSAAYFVQISSPRYVSLRRESKEVINSKEHVIDNEIWSKGVLE